jgi:peptidoglycan/LPS O-acetylase OafA/YrhL
MESQPRQERIYWPELDGLRFLAFLMVFFVHLGAVPEQVFGNCPGDLRRVILRVQSWGATGVDLFFVISGFLITSLIFKEIERHGTFSLQNFLIRRSLRIWPLYYLHLLMMLFVFPLFPAVFLYSFDSPNYQSIIDNLFYLVAFLQNYFAPAFFAGFLWSICCEEQFYITWGVIIKLIGSARNFTVLLLGLWATGIALFYLPALWYFHRASTPLIIGSLLGILFISRPGLIDRIKPYSWVCALGALGIIACVFAHSPKDYFKNPLSILPLGAGYGLSLCTVLTWRPARLVFANPCFVNLGKKTYSMYMFHMWMNSLVFNLLRPAMGRTISNETGLYWFLCACSLAAAIVASYLSWYCFETCFLNLRSRFSQVKSGLDLVANKSRLPGCN